MKFSLPSLLCVAALFSFTQLTHAQMDTDKYDDDPYWGTSVYHPYIFREELDTKAPKGFKPFYISHYGRHGSRRQTASNCKNAYEIMTKADQAGVLTPEGKALYKDILTLYEYHKGMMGELAPRGAREHRMLARRMRARFPAVFRNKKRSDVFCQSSTVPRCLVSMANFTSSLQHEVPRLNFDYITGEKYMDLLAHDFYKSSEIFASDNRLFDSLTRANVDPERIMQTFFIDDKARVGAIVTDTVKLLKGFYTTGAVCGCVEELGINLYKTYFTKDEIVPLAIAYNNRIFGNYGHSTEFGDRCSWAAKWLLEDILNRADKAMEPGSTIAADLRFGHDTGIMPLAALIRLEGFDRQVPRAESHKYFDTAVMMTMATNLQMVFYRNRSGLILVKILYNEKETLIPELSAYEGPYYKWSDVRAYFAKLCADKSDPV